MTVSGLDSLVALSGALRRGEFSPVEATAAALERISRQNAALGAFVEVTADRAIDAARALGRPDPHLPLWGVPLADKDLVARAGVPTRYGSRAFAGHVPTSSDPLALALDDTGAISLGKTNTPEFGLAGYTESDVAPPARNPWNPSTGAGGSSGGAAVAVAAGMLTAAPASDGGGSIRIPASTVGVVGLKPARGYLVPRGTVQRGLDGLAVSGPIARSVEDAAYLLDALRSSAPYGAASDDLTAASRRDPRRLTIGVTEVSPWQDSIDLRIAPEATSAIDAAIGILLGAGHTVDDLPWHPGPYSPTFRTLWRAAASRIRVPDDRLDAEVEPITAWLIREGRALDQSVVSRAIREAEGFGARTAHHFAAVDVVLTPALGTEPQPIGWARDEHPEENFIRQCRYSPFTSYVNVAGLPAITVPVWGAPRPVSVQLIGRRGHETDLIALAAQLEAARGPLAWPPGITPPG